MDLGKILSSKNNSVLVDYLLFLLKKKQVSIILEKLDNELQSQIDANRTVHNCGAQYETYAYLKKKKMKFSRMARVLFYTLLEISKIPQNDEMKYHKIMKQNTTK